MLFSTYHVSQYEVLLHELFHESFTIIFWGTHDASILQTGELIFREVIGELHGEWSVGRMELAFI